MHAYFLTAVRAMAAMHPRQKGVSFPGSQGLEQMQVAGTRRSSLVVPRIDCIGIKRWSFTWQESE